ncbi:MAG: hypothetical protein A2268_11880 [Candidatus Raymondbacteria bacterium RifOxyA12_full_50_37]|uniref:Uncharacterized protein n=1 Tax=Candidatus Raymondbacteria bacterium RIFOXYD12_FULL_49_13 TaxID=1817890 RepID=A0A1F7FKI7_UNCRA|nr:MAG: hypothetical protein A2268_11880 [Candidatus Raymondbacteria bacterium RifOxyA12_full_50_37]OGJ91722.1 MAG: hypothetical protein A2248_13775 [Candidatus Raymondbacteria bacterium RIFOXYA2_FULL_49_16]OGK03931.1 MAG: hypothetical protein A2350_15035 [Candidatus Raymondbacteria bacterium RifOxyB12_full_50_8]OGK06972.1 MAG: hypothetical protein A2519_17360 [Candidatus Raymondbacteria bacterium RIFOXYD12_FULL_49_13]OGP43913.1 MAG: hypothetical protein A2324_00380 [Candidatus Raymondbacteria 
MRTISIAYPENILPPLNISPDAFEAEAKEVLAVKLFEMGRLTSGQAAGIANVSRAEFLLTCRKFGTPSVQWNKEDIDEEFKAGKI